MHGIIHYELKKFVEARYGGHQTWEALLKAADLEGVLYLPSEIYSDTELVAILTAASNATGKSIHTLQEEFGEFIVPDLVRTYKAFIKKEWSMFDFFEHVEDTIHATVRRTSPGAQPPKLKVIRTASEQVIIEYSSERKMYGVLHGILKGVISLYSTPVQVKVLNESPVYRVEITGR